METFGESQHKSGGSPNGGEKLGQPAGAGKKFAVGAGWAGGSLSSLPLPPPLAKACNFAVSHLGATLPARCPAGVPSHREEFRADDAARSGPPRCRPLWGGVRTRRNQSARRELDQLRRSSHADRSAHSRSSRADRSAHLLAKRKLAHVADVAGPWHVDSTYRPCLPCNPRLD